MLYFYKYVDMNLFNRSSIAKFRSVQYVFDCANHDGLFNIRDFGAFETNKRIFHGDILLSN